VQDRDLFEHQAPPLETIAPGMVLLRAWVDDRELVPMIEQVGAVSPFRHLETPGGKRMSVAMTNCGALGWVSDRRGYRYEPLDPQTGAPWPAMPERFAAIARGAAALAGFEGFAPDACLVNRYAPGTRLTAHQDRDECDFAHPIVSVSLGLPATFLIYGERRAGRPQQLALASGDVLVFGGPARRWYHGVRDLADGVHPVTGHYRYNLTFRRAR
jgi:alkylated DNA repair protein (DNA oxidative demethylase)